MKDLKLLFCKLRLRVLGLLFLLNLLREFVVYIWNIGMFILVVFGLKVLLNILIVIIYILYLYGILEVIKNFIL